MLTTVGNLKNGITFWVSATEKKPRGLNVFVIPDENGLSAILGELGEVLPNRND